MVRKLGARPGVWVIIRKMFSDARLVTASRNSGESVLRSG
jgi:hypothetical protein